jgi:hypothetical protein
MNNKESIKSLARIATEGEFHKYEIYEMQRNG